MTNLGSSNTPIVGENITTTVAEITDTNSPYTTQGENQIEADTSSGSVTVTIASADIPASGEPARPLTIINTSTGDLTIETEGSEQIQPDGTGSLTLSADNVYVEARLVAGAVYLDRSKALSTVSTERERITRESPVLRGSVGWRSDFDGADPDSRLDNAIAAASNGDTIYLENATYSDTRTFSTRLVLIGTSSYGFNGTQFEGDWTLDERVDIKHVGGGGSDNNITINADRTNLSYLDLRGGDTITVAADGAILTNIRRGDVTFQSGTASGIIDSSSQTTVTDNGSNTVGDIA